MREYLFHGKRLDNGEWAQGQYLYDDVTGKGWITLSITESQKTIGGLFVYCVEVDPETVGQFTGFEVYKDPHLITGEDGKDKLFESDVVRFSDFDYNGVDREKIGVIYWCDGGFFIDCTHKYGDDAIYDIDWVLEQDDCVERIGNRWDNPELLEDGAS